MNNPALVSIDLLDFLDSLPEPRLVLGSDYRIITSNKAYQEIFGEGTSINGKHCYEVSNHNLTFFDQQGDANSLNVTEEKKLLIEFFINLLPIGGGSILLM